jgi:zinc protease
MNAASSSMISDDQLWLRSRKGDREAFGQIVERYQSLVCSLAYSACGSLVGSEDLGQETFLTAWQELEELREPSKLRSWLCGIVRNLSATALRREYRRGGPAKSLDSVADPVVSHVDPATQAVSQEQADMLWRSLGQLSETYREPMVLFYRQGQSVAEVAKSLDLSEEAVKQRLSRGRSMLREELESVVETTLTRTRPTKAFTAAVLAMIPVSLPQSAAASVIASVASGKGAAAAKGVLGSPGAWPFLGPVIGLMVGWFSAQAAASTGRSPEERASVRRLARRMVIFCWLMSIGLVLALISAGRFYPASPLGIVIGVLVWVVVLVGTILWACSRNEAEVQRIRAATGTNDESFRETLAAKGIRFTATWRYQSKVRVLGLPLVDIVIGDADGGSTGLRRAVGWVAVGDVAISPLIAMGGFAVGPFALGAITVGFLSLSLYGIGLGALAVGSIALGWWSFGLGAIGWKSAAGGAVVAREYALGALARAAEVNTPAAKEWFFSQWFVTPVAWFVYSAHWIILLIVVVSLTRLWRRSRLIRRATMHESR